MQSSCLRLLLNFYREKHQSDWTWRLILQHCITRPGTGTSQFERTVQFWSKNVKINRKVNWFWLFWWWIWKGITVQLTNFWSISTTLPWFWHFGYCYNWFFCDNLDSDDKLWSKFLIITPFDYDLVPNFRPRHFNCLRLLFKQKIEFPKRPLTHFPWFATLNLQNFIWVCTKIWG